MITPEDIAKMKLDFDKASVPKEDRWLVIDGVMYTNNKEFIDAIIEENGLTRMEYRRGAWKFA